MTVSNTKRNVSDLLEIIPRQVGGPTSEYYDCSVENNSNQFFHVNIQNLQIGKGSYGTVFVCQSSINSDPLAIKFEEALSNRTPTLYYDQQFLHFFTRKSKKHDFVPEFFDYGKSGQFFYLVMELLGPNLADLIKEAKNNGISAKTKVFLCIGMLNAIHFIHEQCFIHRDIKPENFALGSLKHSKRIYLIDFGFTKKYLDSNGDHIKLKRDKYLIGTRRYVSLNTHKGLEQSRRDDMESLGYLFLYLWCDCKVPWMDLKCPDKEALSKLIEGLKESTDLFNINPNCPPEIPEYVYYARSLTFTQKPDYRRAFNYLLDIGVRYKVNWNNQIFDWDTNKSIYSKLKTDFDRINYPQNS